MNKGTEALNKILAEVHDMSPEEYMELYNQAPKRESRSNRIEHTPQEIKEFHDKVAILVNETTEIELNYLKEKGAINDTIRIN